MKSMSGRQLGVAVFLLLAAAYVFLHDPTAQSWYPQCAFHQWTGFWCPGCGTTRAVYALLHGHVVEAFRLNAFTFLSGLFFAAYYFAPERVHAVVRPKAWWGVVYGTLAVAFGVLRNIPHYPFSLLAP